MADPDSVAIAYVFPTDVAHSWHRSMLELGMYDFAHNARTLRGGTLAMRGSAGGLVEARNKAIREFLDADRADWLFWIDTDMGFEPDTVERLLEAADPVERPIVGALAFALREREQDGMGGFRCAAAPTIFDWVQRPDGVRGLLGRAQYSINTLTPCDGTGSACILIHRSVFEKIAAHPLDGDESDAGWYGRIRNPGTGQLIGEDLSFCLRARAQGFPIYVHTGVRTTHLKHFWLAEEDYWTRAIAPPATRTVDVIVPVLRRPDNAAPFMESLRASTGLATVWAIAEKHDDATIGAWHAAGAQHVICADTAHTFAEKVNLGFRRSSAPWIFITGDDVRFAPGWLDHAQAIAGDERNVIGTNDCGNPRVTSGEHATHLLIRRTYVETMGASWDGPGIVAHEGYRHWYVDDEIVTTAKQRGVWGMALGAIVEHMHPMWGKAPDDDVYELGASHAEQDGALFRKRCEEFL